MVTRVLVALGSNVGDRAGYVREAMDRLETLAEDVVERSAIYMTDPQDMEDDAEEFANAAVSFRTRLTAVDLLSALQAIEVDMGRPRDHERNVSRTIDLDIIDFGGTELASKALTLPHPRAHERMFVLMPLMELAPDLALQGRTVRERLRGLLGAAD